MMPYRAVKTLYFDVLYLYFSGGILNIKLVGRKFIVIVLSQFVDSAVT